MQGFNRALEPALLSRWRVTSHNLAELCRGGPLNPRAQFGIRRSFCCCVAPSVPRQLAEALYEASSQHWGKNAELRSCSHIGWHADMLLGLPGGYAPAHATLGAVCPAVKMCRGMPVSKPEAC